LWTPEFTDLDEVLLEIKGDVWAVEMRVATDVKAGLSANVVVRTSLDHDRLSLGQRSKLIKPTPTATSRLGEAWLAPSPFRKLKRSGTEVRPMTSTSRPLPPMLALRTLN
jgi:hypothetical protein